MAPSTRDKLVQTAHDLFYSEGFHVVGLDRILAEVGIVKATFYNHFASKDDLLLEVLRWHDTWWQDTFRKMLRRHGGDAPRDQLLALPDALAELFDMPDYNGCIFVNIAVQFPRPHEPAHQLAARHKRSMEDLLRELAGYAGASDALGLARELGLIAEGAYVTRQVSQAADTVTVARRLVEMVVDHHVPVAA